MSSVTLPDDRRAAAGTLPPIAWKDNPLDRHDLGVLAAAWIAVVAVLTTTGTAMVQWWEGSSFGELDADVNRWFERRRTPTWTTLADFGSAFSDTITVIAVGVVCIPLFVWLFRRWHDYVMVFVGLAFEATAFVTVSTIVGRDRPPVDRLGGAPTNSFPSGHIAASVALYGGLAAVVFVQTRRPAARAAATAAAITIPSVVVVSRVYLGMHYVTDALGGVALGVVVVLLMRHLAIPRETPAPPVDGDATESPVTEPPVPARRGPT